MTIAPMAGMGGMMIPQMPKHTGMFGAGGGKLDIAGLGQALIGGYLAGRGMPGGNAILGMMNQRQQAKQEAEQYGQRREDEFQDFVRKQAWQIANNPKTQQPHYFEDNAGNLMAIGPDGKPQMVHKDPLPFKLVPNGLGGVVPVDLRTLMANQGGQEEILDELPQGAKPIGGPTPRASGGFPF